MKGTANDTQRQKGLQGTLSVLRSSDGLDLGTIEQLCANLKANLGDGTAAHDQTSFLGHADLEADELPDTEASSSDEGTFQARRRVTMNNV